MNFNLTLKEYIELVSNLTIQEIIVYYFFAYLFISVIKKILNQEIGLDGIISTSIAISFKTQPKILLTLELIYILGLSRGFLDVYFDLNNSEVLFIIIFGFIIILFLIVHFIEKIFYRLIYAWKIKSRSKQIIIHEQEINKRNAVLDQAKLKKNSQKFANFYRDRLNVAIINLVLVIILLFNSVKIGLIVFVVTLILSVFHLSSHFKLIKKTFTDLNSNSSAVTVRVIN